MRMMAENNIRKGKPFDNAELGRKMFFKGRLKILPPKSLRGFKRWMKGFGKDEFTNRLIPGMQPGRNSLKFRDEPDSCVLRNWALNTTHSRTGIAAARPQPTLWTTSSICRLTCVIWLGPKAGL